MTARSELIRDAVLRMPVTFLATDMFEALPGVERQAISNVLTSMVKQGQIAYDGNEMVTVEVPAPTRPGGVYRARHPVRRFTRPGEPLIKLPPVGSAARTALTEPMLARSTSGARRVVSWDDGAKALAIAFAAWPGTQPITETDFHD